MTRRLWVALAAVAALLVAGCGGSDDTGAGDSNGGPSSAQAAEASITTIGALGLDLPFTVPTDIPAPGDGAYAGLSANADPYEAVLISTDMDADEIRAALKDYGDSIGAGYEPNIEQIQFTTDLDGTTYSVYAWMRADLDSIDGDMLLEIGRIELPS